MFGVLGVGLPIGCLVPEMGFVRVWLSVYFWVFGITTEYAMRIAEMTVVGLVVMIMIAGLLGCSTTVTEADSRINFAAYDRVAILGQLERADEEFFIPKYMQAFPNHLLVERRDLGTVLTEQDFLVDRLDPAKRVELHRLYGVDGIVYPNFTDANRVSQFAVKVIDTLTGEIVAAVLVTPKRVWGRDDATRRDLIERAIGALEAEKDEAITQAVRRSWNAGSVELSAAGAARD